MSEAEQNRLKRGNDPSEERALRQQKQREREKSLRQTQFDQERGKFREYQREQQSSLRESKSETQIIIYFVYAKFDCIFGIYIHELP